MKELIARLRAALLILGFGLAATGCDGGPTPMASEGEELVPAEAAEVEHEVVRIPLDFTVFNECAGEEVHFTGFVQFVFHRGANRGVDLGDFFQHSVENTIFKLQGMGIDSGKTYQFNGTDFNIIQAEDPVEPFPLALHFLSKAELTRQGDGVIASLTFNFVLVFDANGNLAALHLLDVFDECFFA